MSEKDSQPAAGINLGDIYFVLFRHKWLILSSALLGILAVVVLMFVVKPPKFRSHTKLLIKYVTESVGPVKPGHDESIKPLDDRAYSLMTTEILLLTSLDLARDVAMNVGPEKILAQSGGGSDTNSAAAVILKGLDIEQVSGGNVLDISFENPDPQVVQEVLKQIIISYYKKHNEMHQPVELTEFQSKEAARLRHEVTQIDQELRDTKARAGVISADETQKTYADRLSQLRNKIDDGEASLAEHQAMLKQMTQLAVAVPGTTNAGPVVSSLEQVNEYKGLCARLDMFSRREQDLLTQYTSASTPVQQVRQQIAETQKLKKALEKQYPYLASLTVTPVAVTGSGTETNAVNPGDEAAQVVALQSKIQVLKSQLQQVWSQATNAEAMISTIEELQRKKEIAENNLNYYSANVERSQMEAAMGDQSAPNISVLESPTPPVKSWSKQFKKKVAMVGAAGAFGGLALAFLIELVLDTSVKRPGDIETKLRLPLLISIPDATRNGFLKKLSRRKNKEAGSTAFAPPVLVEGDGWNQIKPLNRFYTGLRDRLLVYFEVRNVNHKPKLVAVTSCNQGAGVTSIAAGLAASLSETGDGNVLLVDMNPEQQAVQQFHKGKLATGLASALEPETKNDNRVQEKLYVVAEQVKNEKEFRILPKRFSEMVPKLKASDYDYIIFDMPPVSPTSVTPRLAGLMDMVVLVLESEKTNRDVVKKVNALLAESKANVSTVLNKTRNYVPAKLHQEYLNDV